MKRHDKLNLPYFGLVESTYDAFILAEACLSGQVKSANRRPFDCEREHAIRSGSVFIYEENKSEMRRWTDGMMWTPSRMCGNFLVYRQLDKPFKRGERRRPIGSIVGRSRKDKKALSKIREQNAGRPGAIPTNPGTPESYVFADDSLVKKTINILCDKMKFHIVSYFTVADVEGRRLWVPSQDPKFMHMQPRHGMTTPYLRVPVFAVEPLNRKWFKSIPSSPLNKNPPAGSGLEGPPCFGRPIASNSNITAGAAKEPAGMDRVPASTHNIMSTTSAAAVPCENLQPAFSFPMAFPRIRTASESLSEEDEAHHELFEDFSFTSLLNSSRPPIIPILPNLQQVPHLSYCSDPVYSGILVPAGIHLCNHQA